MKEFTKQLFTDENGKASMTRLMTFMFAVLFIFTVIYHPLVGFTSEPPYALIQSIVLLGMGATGVRSAVKNAKV